MSNASQLDALICCPTCDEVYRFRQPGFGERAVCERCHTRLIVPRKGAGLQILAFATTAAILVIAAMIFPFLSVEVGGMRNDSSILDAALAFADGPLMALSLLLFALIIFVPLCRVGLLVYVLLPIVLDRPPARYAAAAFRLAERLRVWSMAEIFAIGCAVALVKVSDLAQVGLGPAFWLFGALVIAVVMQDRYMCRWSVWKSLETPA